MRNLSGNIDQLLPLSTDAPSCSEHTQTICLDPRGTALNIEAIKALKDEIESLKKEIYILRNQLKSK